MRFNSFQKGKSFLFVFIFFSFSVMNFTQISTTKKKPKPVSVSQAAAVPDLTIISLTCSHPPKQGDTLGSNTIFNAVVKNQGPVAAPPSKVSITCSSLSGSPSPSGLSGTVNCIGLPANGTTTITWPNQATGVWPAGTFRLVFKVDSQGTVTEGNEGNNTKSIDVTAMPTLQAVQPQTPGNLQSNLQSNLQAGGTTQAVSGAASQNMSLKAITLTSPPVQGMLLTDKTHTITWTDSQKKASHVGIQLFYNNSLKSTISTNAPNSGSFQWLPPKHNEADPSKFELKIFGVGQGTNYSDKHKISLYNPAIKITSPVQDGTHVWTMGQSYTVTWQNVGVPSELKAPTVYIGLYKSSGALIHLTTSNDGSETINMTGFSWSQIFPGNTWGQAPKPNVAGLTLRIRWHNWTGSNVVEDETMILLYKAETSGAGVPL